MEVDKFSIEDVPLNASETEEEEKKRETRRRDQPRHTQIYAIVIIALCTCLLLLNTCFRSEVGTLRVYHLVFVLKRQESGVLAGPLDKCAIKSRVIVVL